MANLESLASVLGLSVAVTRFLLCFVGSIPCSALARWMPAGAVRNVYAAATGMVLSYISFGPEANLFYCFPLVVGYGSMILARQYCGFITFVAAFGFLLTWYVASTRKCSVLFVDRGIVGETVVLQLKLVALNFILNCNASKQRRHCICSYVFSPVCGALGLLEEQLD